jgi:hypothetical protein
MMFRCVAAIPNTGGNCLEHFYPDRGRCGCWTNCACYGEAAEYGGFSDRAARLADRLAALG